MKPIMKAGDGVDPASLSERLGEIQYKRETWAQRDRLGDLLTMSQEAAEEVDLNEATERITRIVQSQIDEMLFGGFKPNPIKDQTCHDNTHVFPPGGSACLCGKLTSQ